MNGKNNEKISKITFSRIVFILTNIIGTNNEKLILKYKRILSFVHLYSFNSLTVSYNTFYSLLFSRTYLLRQLMRHA